MACIGFIALGIFALGIVGRVENGGDLALMLWLIPITLAMLPCVAAINRNMELERRNRHNRRGKDRRAA